MPVGHVLRRVQGRQQGRWADDEADAQRREHGLGEGADEDGASGRVEGVQAFGSASAVADFGVVVVLDDGGAVAVGPGQQFESSVGRTRH